MVFVSLFPFMRAPGRRCRAPVPIASHPATSAAVPDAALSPASVQSSYRFLALEKTVQEIAEKKRTNQPLVPEKKAVLEEQASQ